MGKLKFILVFAAIVAMPGWESAIAAQPNALKNFLNNLDRKVCQKFNAPARRVQSRQQRNGRNKPTAHHAGENRNKFRSTSKRAADSR